MVSLLLRMISMISICVDERGAYFHHRKHATKAKQKDLAAIAERIALLSTDPLTSTLSI